jgi:hypothetical protein
MGRQKKGNANAQRNNNAKEMQKRAKKGQFPTYPESEVRKMEDEDNKI